MVFRAIIKLGPFAPDFELIGLVFQPGLADIQDFPYPKPGQWLIDSGVVSRLISSLSFFFEW